MADTDPPPEDPDDWFAGSDDDAPGTATSFESRAATVENAAAADDWLEGRRTRRTTRKPAATPNVAAAKLAAAALLAVALIVAGLAFAGVFSSGGKQATTVSTRTGTTTSTATTPTTPTTPTVQVPPAPTAATKPGDSGTQVKVLQRALARLGYRTGPVDGSYGPVTQAAVTSFQTAKKLTVDGIVGPRDAARAAPGAGGSCADALTSGARRGTSGRVQAQSSRTSSRSTASAPATTQSAWVRPGLRARRRRLTRGEVAAARPDA